jgi:DNA recombination protein RmuC
LVLGLKFGKSQTPQGDQSLVIAELRGQLDKEKSDFENYRNQNTDAKVLQTELKAMKDTVESLRTQSSTANTQRTEAESALKTLIAEIQKSTTDQTNETRKIAGALSNSQGRGKFGEAKLERLLELAGLEKGIHFDAQESTTDEDSNGIPDVTVYMPGETKIFIDSKFPFRDFFDALESPEGAERDQKLEAHVEKLRGHITALAKRKYQTSEASPDFVVMFLPFESLLSEAQRIDPKILDFAFSKQVTLTTPATMLALLHSTALVFRRAALAQGAQEIKDVAKKFLNDITSLHVKLVNLGKAVNKLHEAYEDVIPTVTKTVLTPARKISKLGIAGDPEKLKLEYPAAPGYVREIRLAESADDFVDAELLELPAEESKDQE